MPVVKECARCQATFLVSPSRVERVKFCSAECRDAVKGSVLLTCDTCQKEFPCPPSHLRRRPVKFCSRACATISKRIPVEDRFWTKVNKDGPVVRPEIGPCWVWTGMVNANGYGRIVRKSDDGKRHDPYAHRVAYEEASGEAIPDALDVLHVCDTPPCVRNDERGIYVVDGVESPRWGHLFLGTQIDNTTDRDEKDRVRHGERHANAKLTRRSVGRIRTLHKTGLVSQRELADMFGVSHQSISDIVTRRTWVRAE